MPKRREEEKKSYLVFRGYRDYIVVHTKPVTRDEAWWLYHFAYKDWFLSPEDSAKYLAEWGNVLYLGKYAERYRGRLYDPVGALSGVYESLEKFQAEVDKVLAERLEPQDRQLLEEVAAEVRDFLRRPVEPRPVEAPVRYFEMPHPHVVLRSEGWVRQIEPRPELYVYKRGYDDVYGVSVFGREFWLWRQDTYTYGGFFAKAIVVRRDASDDEVVRAALSDEVVQEFLKMHAKKFRELVNERGGRLRSGGYGDVAERAKLILAALELLSGGREEEEGEALPA